MSSVDHLDFPARIDEETATKEWLREQFAALRDRDGDALDELRCALLAETRADWHEFDRLLRAGCLIEVAFGIIV